jgi:hypothetical protein
VHVDPPYDVAGVGDDHGGHRQHHSPVCVHGGQVESKLQLGSPCLVGRLGQEHPPSVEQARRAAAEAGLADRVSYQVLDVAAGLPESFRVIAFNSLY